MNASGNVDETVAWSVGSEGSIAVSGSPAQRLGAETLRVDAPSVVGSSKSDA